jgi:hypothetical protein
VTSILQFYVSGIIETLGTKAGLNIGCDGLDTDLCWGVLINGQTTVTQFLQKHAGAYNYIMLDDIVDGAPMIRVIRRAVNSDLSIDHTLNQVDCITSGDPSTTPALKYTRVDPASLPRTVELQYISYDREFSVNAQYARNDAAKSQQNIMSVQIDFVLSDDQARAMAYDIMWRVWLQQQTISFVHPDLTVEPSDIVQLNTEQGVFVVQILTSMITKEPNDSQDMGRVNQLSGQLLLTKRGAPSIAAGSISVSGATGAHTWNVGADPAFVGSPAAPGLTIAAGASTALVGSP